MWTSRGSLHEGRFNLKVRHKYIHEVPILCLCNEFIRNMFQILNSHNIVQQSYSSRFHQFHFWAAQHSDFQSKRDQYFIFCIWQLVKYFDFLSNDVLTSYGVFWCFCLIEQFSAHRAVWWTVPISVDIGTASAQAAQTKLLQSRITLGIQCPKCLQ